jgi:starvation-inducible DNA-binding protein
MAQSTQPLFEKLLANTFVLSLKTKNFHWNVKGPHFFSLHNMFEEQYTELDTAIDDIAEGLRQGGHIVPATLTYYDETADLQSADGHIPANDMVKALAADHQLVIDSIEGALGNDVLDLTPGQEDLLMSRLGAHKKTHWMLESSVA